MIPLNGGSSTAEHAHSAQLGDDLTPRHPSAAGLAGRDGGQKLRAARLGSPAEWE